MTSCYVPTYVSRKKLNAKISRSEDSIDLRRLQRHGYEWLFIRIFFTVHPPDGRKNFNFVRWINSDRSTRVSPLRPPHLKKGVAQVNDTTSEYAIAPCRKVHCMTRGRIKPGRPDFTKAVRLPPSGSLFA